MYQVEIQRGKVFVPMLDGDAFMRYCIGADEGINAHWVSIITIELVCGQYHAHFGQQMDHL